MNSDKSNESEGVFNMRGCDTSDLPTLELGINKVPVKCLVDSGASNQDLAVDLVSTDKLLFPYDMNTLLHVKGVSSAELNHRDKKMVAEFVMVRGRGVPLIVVKTCRELGESKVGNLEDAAVNLLDKHKGFEYLQHKYENCFKGLGKLTQYQLKFHIDENVKPIAQPIRRVTFNLRQGIEKTL